MPQRDWICAFIYLRRLHQLLEEPVKLQLELHPPTAYAIASTALALSRAAMPSPKIFPPDLYTPKHISSLKSKKERTKRLAMQVQK